MTSQYISSTQCGISGLISEVMQLSDVEATPSSLYRAQGTRRGRRAYVRTILYKESEQLRPKAELRTFSILYRAQAVEY